MLFLLSACGMQRDFHQRRYLSGHYADKSDRQQHAGITRDRKTNPEPTAVCSKQDETPAREQTDFTPAENNEVRFSPVQALKEKDKDKIRTESLFPEKSPGIKTNPPARNTAGDQPGNEPMSGDFYGTFFTILVIGMIAGGIYLIVAGSVALGIILICLPVITIVILAIIIGRAMDKAHRQIGQSIRRSCDGCGRSCHGF